MSEDSVSASTRTSAEARRWARELIDYIDTHGRRRIVMVGQEPNKATGELKGPGYALTGACGKRLASLCGWEYAIPGERFAYLRAFLRVNVLRLHSSRYPSDVRASRLASRTASLLKPFLADRATLLVGKFTACAFGHHAPWMSWQTTRQGGRVASIPHPSGRNRWYNESENRAALARFLRRTIETEVGQR